MASGGFRYWFYDGAFYRRPADAPGVGVRDILVGGAWKPYDSDDLIAPVHYGSEVSEDEVEGVGEKAAAGA